MQQRSPWRWQRTASAPPRTARLAKELAERRIREAEEQAAKDAAEAAGKAAGNAPKSGPAPKAYEPGDDYPEGLSFESGNPSTRAARAGDNLLEYSINGDVLNLDYVEGLASPRLLLRILKSDPAACSIKKITGYTTLALEKVPDADILSRAKNLLPFWAKVGLHPYATRASSGLSILFVLKVSQ